MSSQSAISNHKSKIMRVKICGLTNLDDALAAIEAGADMLGFIFYAKSPRAITPDACAKIISTLQSPITIVGLFVNEPPGYIAGVLQHCGLDLAQLHGDETVETVAALQGRAYKAFRGPGERHAEFAAARIPSPPRPLSQRERGSAFPSPKGRGARGEGNEEMAALQPLPPGPLSHRERGSEFPSPIGRGVRGEENEEMAARKPSPPGPLSQRERGSAFPSPTGRGTRGEGNEEMAARKPSPAGPLSQRERGSAFPSPTGRGARGEGNEGPAFLLDAHVPGSYGGTGQTADWAAARKIARHYPILLAGGLTPENVADAIAQVQPWGVDVSSGVERAPGRKDHVKVRSFVERAKRAGEKVSG
jgi:phosphoribosylanthranilate isomerase